MLRSGVRPDRLTYPYVLKSVAGLCLCDVGKGVHCLIVKSGVELSTFVRISLLDMYVKVEELGLAAKVFDERPKRNRVESVVLWNVLINGWCKAGELPKAVELFKRMGERNSGSWNSLIDGYMRNGDWKKASELFEQMPDKNVVSWTIMVSGLSSNGEDEKGLEMFFRMLDEGVRANDRTIVSALSASAKFGALESGLRIHEYISSNGFKLNAAVATALIDMYSKCGDIQAAELVFNKTKEKNLLTWTAMIWGWAIHGKVEQALQCFKQMMYSGVCHCGAYLYVLFDLSFI